MANCSRCQVLLTKENAYRKTDKRLQSYCKKCFNNIVTERWKQRKLAEIQKKGNKCLDCQGSFHYSVYEFHHLEPEHKDFNWTKLRLRKQSDIDAELSKCVLLCANCHRTRHHS